VAQKQKKRERRNQFKETVPVCGLAAALQSRRSTRRISRAISKAHRAFETQATLPCVFSLFNRLVFGVYNWMRPVHNLEVNKRLALVWVRANERECPNGISL